MDYLNYSIKTTLWTWSNPVFVRGNSNKDNLIDLSVWEGWWPTPLMFAMVSIIFAKGKTQPDPELLFAITSITLQLWWAQFSFSTFAATDLHSQIRNGELENQLCTSQNYNLKIFKQTLGICSNPQRNKLYILLDYIWCFLRNVTIGLFKRDYIQQFSL